ncbi:hypothetical protein, partial [Streptomyces sp. NPDC049949]|uniref:hypothetical protein n=1 Tax=Streptomyces sp. NPDC049949 TaxID=3154627 RepID=UPI0034206EF7
MGPPERVRGLVAPVRGPAAVGSAAFRLPARGHEPGRPVGDRTRAAPQSLRRLGAAGPHGAGAGGVLAQLVEDGIKLDTEGYRLLVNPTGRFEIGG